MGIESREERVLPGIPQFPPKASESVERSPEEKSSFAEVSSSVESSSVSTSPHSFTHSPDLNSRLQFITSKKEFDQVIDLAKLGADIDLQDDDGRTVLHHIVEAGDLGLACELIALGANFTIKDKFGKKPLDLFSSQEVPEFQGLKQSCEKMNLLFIDLKKIAASDPRLNDLALRKYSYLIADVLPRIDMTKKVLKQEMSLHYSIIFSKTDKPRLIILLQKKGRFSGEGTYKKVSEAVVISLVKGEFSILKPTVMAISKKSLSEKEVRNIHREYAIQAKLSHLKGVAEVHFVLDINGRVAGFMPAMDKGNLYEYAIRSTNEFIDTAMQITEGLAGIHGEGYIHGDVKALNMLISREFGRLIAKVSDFGFAFKPWLEPFAHLVFSRGFYGSIDCTSPELFGRQNFNGDWFKTDVFALGFMLYHKKFGTYPPWRDLLMKYEKKWATENVTPEDKKKFEEMVIKSIDEKLKTLPQNTPEEKMVHLIFRMLQSRPEERPTMQEALKEMQKFR